MRQFSTVELAQQISTVTHAAAQEPIEITHHRKPKFVLMTVERYQSLVSGEAKDMRQAFTLDTLPDDLRRGLLAAADRYEREHPDD